MFVVKDRDTELYYNKISHSLVELSKATTYESIELAKHHCSAVQHDLTWGYLEDLYHIDRWHLDISFTEWSKVMKMFGNLFAVEVNINEAREKRKKK